MTNATKSGRNIASHLRSLGYNIKTKSDTPWVTFYIDDTFLFCSDLEILPERVCEEILLELLKEKTNVPVHSKD